MNPNISTDIINQSDLIQQIIDNQSMTDSYYYFIDKLKSAAEEKSFFLQGIYCYALASLFYKYHMYKEALEYGDKSLSYFTPLSDDPASKNFLLWIILELGYINCAKGNTANTEAVLSEYSLHVSDESPLLKHHRLLLNIRILLDTDTFNNRFDDIDNLLKYTEYAVIRRHFPEYNKLFTYFLAANSYEYAGKLIDILKQFNNSGTSTKIKRQYWAAVTKYYMQLEDEDRFEKAFLEYEQQIIARKEVYRQAKLDIINSKERIYHQNELKDKLKDKVETLKKVSRTDTLTGLPNRYSFNEYGQVAFKKAFEAAQPLGLILIDIDNFKHYNDTYGHLVGDRCLSLVGQVMQEVFSEHFVARYGGDEFIAILMNCSIDEMMKAATELQKRLKTHTLINTDESVLTDSITVSQGMVCMTPKQQNSWPDLFHAADIALYTGKMNGRNRITCLPV